jgi:hypothetical protein
VLLRKKSTREIPRRGRRNGKGVNIRRQQPQKINAKIP